MKQYMENRILSIAHYTIDHISTVRSTAKKFGISRHHESPFSTSHHITFSKISTSSTAPQAPAATTMRLPRR